MELNKAELSEYIGKVLKGQWAGKATFIGSAYCDARKEFNEKNNAKNC